MDTAGGKGAEIRPNTMCAGPHRRSGSGDWYPGKQLLNAFASARALGDAALRGGYIMTAV